MKSEVRMALKKMKKNKSPGPDGVVVEMIHALEDFGIDKLTEIINRIYDTGCFPEDLSRSIFIALPKKPSAAECEQHRTISFMSHVTKIIDMRTRQLSFLGHVMRKEGLENLALTGRVEGKRGRGRRRQNWMLSLKNWLEEQGVIHEEAELLKLTKNRELWRVLIAKVT